MRARWLVVVALAGCGSVSSPSVDGGTPDAGAPDGSPDAAAPANLLRNGDFATDTLNWTAVDTSLSSVNGQARLEQVADVGPGLAWQLVPNVAPGNYRLSAAFVAGSYPASYQIRAGTGVNDGTYTTVTDDDNDGLGSIDFAVPGTTSVSMWVTLNNVSASTGEYAVFDDVALIALP